MDFFYNLINATKHKYNNDKSLSLDTFFAQNNIYKETTTKFEKTSKQNSEEKDEETRLDIISNFRISKSTGFFAIILRNLIQFCMKYKSGTYLFKLHELSNLLRKTSQNVKNFFGKTEICKSLANLMYEIIKKKYVKFLFEIIEMILLRFSYFDEPKTTQYKLENKIFFLDLKPIIFVQLYTIKFQKSVPFSILFDNDFEYFCSDQIIQNKLLEKQASKDGNYSLKKRRYESFSSNFLISGYSTSKEEILICKLVGLIFFNVFISKKLV